MTPFTRTALAAALLLAAMPASAQSIGEKSGLNSLVGRAPATADFVTEAAISDMFELQSSQLAAERGDESAKAFAKHMIADHEKSSGEMKQVIQDGKIQATLPTALDSTHQKKLDTLKGLQGAAFNKQYREDQVKAHKDAVDLFQRYGNGGDNAPLKAFARKTEPTLAEHLKMAQDLQK
ncbi:DUF4142 domain-containing protein [Methylobacterium symbioticum]|uniref:DUF4142 domain-containing protein n=1 Tax=Methylobacterium symbioticum TaxID=2584084 RepID=A0A509EA60_9HYPH|nr:DUF4142 domain-containing protein [Methylobacterium symbioticum]VUD70574.1 hypothetical protein MET9862_01144 [Methylobacterium symbioticum]